ncbi:MAG: hypothetical protein F6K03_12005, partial [Kamptonema sp. SIO4C4]|nr:hypothetical protein [Kamptonema sp. SIO4C4]
VLQYALLDTGICAGTRGLEEAEFSKATLDAKCLVGGALAFNPAHNFMRLPGTLASPWHWSWFLIASAAIVSASAWSEPSPLWKKISFLAMGLLGVATIFSGVQFALTLVPLLLILALLATRAQWKQSPASLIITSLILVVLIALIPALLSWDFMLEQLSWAMQNDPQLAWAEDQNLGFFGRGLGKATNAARLFGRTQLVETFYAKLLYEMGYLGILTFLGVVSSLCWVIFQIWRSLSHSPLQRYALCLWLFLLSVSYNNHWYPLEANPVNVYYWFWAGIALKLPILDHQQTAISRQPSA